MARQIIQEQVRGGGKALPWQDRELYTYLMLERSIRSYEENSWVLQPTFFDRGMPDTLGYARLIGLTDDRPIRVACDQYRCASPVFIAPPWEEIYGTDTERKQDFGEARRTCTLVARTYQECGYELIELPKLAPEPAGRVHPGPAGRPLFQTRVREKYASGWFFAESIHLTPAGSKAQ